MSDSAKATGTLCGGCRKELFIRPDAPRLEWLRAVRDHLKVCSRSNRRRPTSSSAAPSEKDVPADATRVELRATSDAAVAAAVARRLALVIGSAKLAAEVATVAAELAANAIRHGRGGTLFVWWGYSALHVATVDGGEGSAQAIDELVRQPGHAGRGLGAVIRLMDELRFANRAGGGLVVWTSRRSGLP